MVDNKLLQVLKVLSPVEFRRLHKFIAGGYHTRNEHILRLMDEFKQSWPEFTAEHWERKAVYERIYPGQAFDMPRLRYLFSDLTVIVEEFFIQQQLADDAERKNQLLRSWYRDKGLDRYYEQGRQLYEDTLETSRLQDAGYYYRQYALKEEVYQYLSEKKNRSGSMDLNTVVTDLDIFYLSAKLKHSCEIVNRSNVLSTPFPDDLKEELNLYLQQRKHESIPAVGNYYIILQTLLQPDETAHYFNFKTQLVNTQHHFAKLELRDLYGYAQNYCIKKINSGNLDFLRELFELYRILLDNKVILENGYVSHSDFKNIVFVSLRLKETIWCLSFIEQASTLLAPAQRKNAYTYNLAYYHFFTGDYKKSLQLLNRIEFTDIFYFLDSRSLLLKNFYELDETDPLLSLLDTFRSGIKRNKQISPYQNRIYLNMTKYVKKLLSYSTRSKTKRLALKTEIEQNRQVADKVWLLQKADELL